MERLRHYVCPECGTPVGNREVVMTQLNDWLWLKGRPPQPEATDFFHLRKKKEETPGIICVGCEQRVRDMQEESAIELSNQSKERALVGEVI